MVIKFLQVNIYKGKYLGSLVDFILKESPDLISMQEVSSGQINNFEDRNVNLFALLKDKIKYNGVFFPNQYILGPKDAFIGNALFSKLPILDSKHIYLHKSRPLTLAEFEDTSFFPNMSKSLVQATIQVGKLTILVLSVHGAWTAPPTDNKETLRQAKLIASHLKSLGDEPFILGGDLNMPPESKVVGIISESANNLMLDSPIKQTTHPQVHKIAPRGYLIDYIFTSKHFKKISIEAPLVLVSDHLPVIATLEI